MTSDHDQGWHLRAFVSRTFLNPVLRQSFYLQLGEPKETKQKDSRDDHSLRGLGKTIQTFETFSGPWTAEQSDWLNNHLHAGKIYGRVEEDVSSLARGQDFRKGWRRRKFTCTQARFSGTVEEDVNFHSLARRQDFWEGLKKTISSFWHALQLRTALGGLMSTKPGTTPTWPCWP
jgi:hypothetical protein